MFSKVNLFLILASSLQTVSRAKQNLKYEILTTANIFVSIVCVIEAFDKYPSRASRYNTLTGTCEPLPDSWFNDQNQDAGYVYFKLRVMEPDLDQTPISIPFDVVEDMKIVIYYDIGFNIYYYNTTRFSQVAVTLRDERHIRKFYMDIRTCCDEIVFTSGTQKRVTYTGATPNTIYKMELVMTSAHIQINIDGVHIHDFGHIVSMPQYKTVAFSGRSGSKLVQIQYFYPV